MKNSEVCFIYTPEDIEADVNRGILERVPPGVPDTWCTRMVITHKKDGEPRRTVDLAAL